MAEYFWGPIFQFGKLRLGSNLTIDGVFVQYNSQRLFRSIIDVFCKNKMMQNKYHCYAIYTKPAYHLFGLIKRREVLLVKLQDIDHALGEVKDYLNIDTYCSYQTILTVRSSDIELIEKYTKRIAIHKENFPYQTEYYKIRQPFGTNKNCLQACGPIFDSREYDYYRDFCDFCRGIIITDTRAK